MYTSYAVVPKLSSGDDDALVGATCIVWHKQWQSNNGYACAQSTKQDLTVALE